MYVGGPSVSCVRTALAPALGLAPGKLEGASGLWAAANARKKAGDMAENITCNTKNLDIVCLYLWLQVIQEETMGRDDRTAQG